jgi:hypothetical protein
MSGRNSGTERRVFQAARLGLDLEMNGRELAMEFAGEIEAGKALEAVSWAKRRRGHRDL